MCGIVGFFDRKDAPGARDALVARMAAALAHRGPDDAGAWSDERSGITFGHRRLSIIDLSQEGHQPMLSHSGRYVIVYNGEVYNYGSLQAELIKQGATFRGHCDTEVILEGAERWGLQAAVSKFIGMFAFALWDREQRKLHLVRDRLGIKPLYYGWNEGRFFFSSELKGISAHPQFRAEINRDAIALLMRYSYIPAPHTIYRGIYKLPQGTMLTLDERALDVSGSVGPTGFSADPSLDMSLKPVPFWQARDYFAGGAATKDMRDEEAIERFDHLLRDAVKLRMIADVPLGAFLSGGIDSSTVVAVMQAQSSQPIKTFSIGFHEKGYNEATFASDVAKHLGTDHTELYMTAQEAMAVIPKLPTYYDEPFADNSQIPTFLVSELARRHVTVSLSGDGGDELLGGYSRYHWTRSIWKILGVMPGPIRNLFAYGIRGLTPKSWDSMFSVVRPIVPGSYATQNFGEKLHKFAALLNIRGKGELYHHMVSHWLAANELVIGSRPLETRMLRESRENFGRSFEESMMYLDLVTYLPDDILTKVDRATMAVSLEGRVPLLDHRVVQFCLELPPRFKMRGTQGKWLLRKVLEKYVPTALIDRPKMGFSLPVGEWLRGPLREWADSLLNERVVRDQGYLRPDMISEKWKQHVAGVRNWQYYLWDVLMFQAWLSENRS